MTYAVKHAIDELENKINEYKKTVMQRQECKLRIDKFEIEIENLSHGWHFEDEDLTFVMEKKKSCVLDFMWFKEAEDLALHSVKHAAYRLGRFRSFTSAEP
jgi:hypothetical protein